MRAADDMENGVLRGNRSAASNLFNLVGLPQFSQPMFRRGDPRASKVRHGEHLGVRRLVLCKLVQACCVAVLRSLCKLAWVLVLRRRRGAMSVHGERVMQDSVRTAA